MKKSLLEATHVHHGSFKDLQTFLDRNGDPMELQASKFGDGTQSDGSGKSRDGQESEQSSAAPTGSDAAGGQESGEETEQNGAQSDSQSNGSGAQNGQEGSQQQDGEQGGQQGDQQQGDNSQQDDGASGQQNSPESQQQQSEPPDPDEPIFKVPEKGQMFRDVNTGKTYKWDGKKFVIQR